MKPPKFTLTEPEYRALRLKAEEASKYRRALFAVRRVVISNASATPVWSGGDGQCECVKCQARRVIDRALARRKQ